MSINDVVNYGLSDNYLCRLLNSRPKCYMSSCCATVLDCLFVVLNVFTHASRYFFLNFVLPIDNEKKLYIDN